MEQGKAYIESGILELYVLGELNELEEQEVEAMAVKDPEVKREITAIELAMERYAEHQAITPPKRLEEEIFRRIALDSVTEPIEQESIAAQVVAAKIPDAIAEEPLSPPSILPLYPDNYHSKIRTLRIALIACAILLVVSGIALYTTRHELGTAKEQIIALNLDKEKFSSTVSYMKENNQDLQTIADMSNDPNWKTVKLAGTKMDPQAKMTVYWHTSGRHVMVDNSKMGLPLNDEAHQYQLWALVNGKPVDLGVFDVKADAEHILVKMKEIGGAQAFAVTLEKRGGVASPTMEQMIAMGGVSI